jgi:hypothetical protein
MPLGRLFIVLGILFLLLGVFFTWGPKIPGIRHLGHLPGDLRIQKEGFSFYFPVVTCLALSLVLTLIFQLIRFFKK